MLFKKLINLLKPKNEIIEKPLSIRARLKKLESYFENQIKHNVRYKVNFEAIRKINSELKSKNITFQTFQNIEQIYNQANKNEADFGSGWIDVKMNLISLAKKNNFQFEWYNDYDIKLLKNNYSNSNWIKIEIVSKCFRENKLNWTSPV